MNKFEITYLPEAITFLESIEQKAAEKMVYNISKAQLINDANYLKS